MKISFDIGSTGITPTSLSSSPTTGTPDIKNMMLMMLIMSLLQANQGDPASTGSPTDNNGLGGTSGVDGSKLDPNLLRELTDGQGLLKQAGKLLQILAPLLQNAGNMMSDPMSTNIATMLEGASIPESA
jgi:hypothetical protein